MSELTEKIIGIIQVISTNIQGSILAITDDQVDIETAQRNAIEFLSNISNALYEIDFTVLLK